MCNITNSQMLLDYGRLLLLRFTLTMHIFGNESYISSGDCVQLVSFVIHFCPAHTSMGEFLRKAFNQSHATLQRDRPYRTACHAIQVQLCIFVFCNVRC